MKVVCMDSYNKQIDDHWNQVVLIAEENIDRVSKANQRTNRTGYTSADAAAEDLTRNAQDQMKKLESLLVESLYRTVDYWNVFVPTHPLPSEPTIPKPPLTPLPKAPDERTFPKKQSLPSAGLRPEKPKISIEDMITIRDSDIKRTQLRFMKKMGLVEIFILLVTALFYKSTIWIPIIMVAVIVSFAIILLSIAYSWIVILFEAINKKRNFAHYTQSLTEEYERKLTEWQDLLAKEQGVADEEYEAKVRKIKSEYQERCRHVNENNNKLVSEWEDEVAKAIKEWESEINHIQTTNQQLFDVISKLKESYLNKRKESIEHYNLLLLKYQKTYDNFQNNHELEYIESDGTLIVNYQLPSIDDLPSIKEVKYIKNKNEYKESYLPQAAINKLYDNVIYQLILARINLLFTEDHAKALNTIVMNGWVEFIDRATGKTESSCIVSICVQRNEFEKINLQNVEPKECFKHLKGIGSSQLHGMNAIAPIAKISTDDRRFIESYEVAKDVTSTTNLAAMDWEDFEHLVREVFANYFSKYGAEVKVTQSSRDKGVDAIAINPDPLVGGRYVIQAKRYTNTVDVSAVRDLWGTIDNEKALKGFLVTTSNFGSDSYDFIKDKGQRITLISGAELLGMLKEYGIEANIDLKEAKRILAEKEKAKL